MKISHRLIISAAAVGMALAGGTTLAQPTQQPMAAMQSDPAARADLDLVHTMVHGHRSITRSVTNLADGIRTLTESSDPVVAAALMAHVGSMMQRLEGGREFNLFSSTIPVLFANRDRIVTRFEMTPRGASVVQTSTDPKVVAALQAHAGEVSELATEGPVAMQRNMQRVAMTGAGRGMGSGRGTYHGAAAGGGHGAQGVHFGHGGRGGHAH
jgi:hypothetical protein